MEKYALKTAALTLSVGASLFFVSLPASPQAAAADIFSPPQSLKDSPALFAPVPWQGFYIGGHAGGEWGGPDVSDKFDYVGDPSFNGGVNGTGFIGGGQAGYNFQRGHFVFGPEVDLGYLGLSASKGGGFAPGSCTAHYSDGDQPYNGNICNINAKYSSSTDLYGDITGRLGYAVDRALFYTKGGVAFLDADFKANYSGQNCTTIGNASWNCSGFHLPAIPSTFNYDHSDTLVGWTIGAGVEYALTPAWSLKAEYQHFDFGSMSYSYDGSYQIPCTPSQC